MATVRNIYIDQGSKFSVPVDLSNADGTPTNLTGFTFRSELKRSYYSLTGVSISAVSETPTSGQIILSLTSAQSLALKPGRYVYDVVMIDDEDEETRVVEGIVTVNPAVSKPLPPEE